MIGKEPAIFSNTHGHTDTDTDRHTRTETDTDTPIYCGVEPKATLFYNLIFIHHRSRDYQK